MKRINSKKTAIVLALLLIVCAAAVLVYRGVGRMLQSQQHAERWQGESQMEFCQMSCFMPEGQGLSIEQVWTFRQDMQTKLKEASLEIDGESLLYTDAWSTTAQVEVSSEHGKGKVQATAVGGNFFDFHPVRLLSGSYFGPEDLMKDRVLLDEETAWLLFGGTELSGLSFSIGEQKFVVAGVFSREDDPASRKAYGEGMGIFMSYEAYQTMTESAAIDCYELVMAEPVEGFTANAVREKFPIKTAELVDNSSRYEPETVFKMLKNVSMRTMHSQGISYPYWENAARAVELWCIALMVLAMAAGVLPFVFVLVLVIVYMVKGKRKLENELLPTVKDNVQEAVRVRQRKRWEKKHLK